MEKKFEEAYRHYYSLSYEEKINYRENLINSTETLQDCISLIDLLNAKGGSEVRTTIIDRMLSIANTDEEKRIANSYRKGEKPCIVAFLCFYNLRNIYIYLE